MKTKSKTIRLLATVLAMLCCIVFIPVEVSTYSTTVSAASVDYPVQLMRIGLYDNSKNLNISGYTDNSAVVASDSNGSQNQNWRFDYVGTNSVGSFFKIANMGCGRLLTPKGYKAVSGTACVTYGSESHTSQHWYITAVSQDKKGTDLYYKITNYDAPDMALTNNSGKLVLSKYTGANEQKFLLSSAGIQGFGGYCKDMKGSPKASVIGGALGEIVEVKSFDELKKACTDTAPKTIIVTKNISGKTSGYEKTLCYDNNYRYICRDNYIYLAPNKTIIGSYGANTLHNVFFRTYDHQNYGLGNNVIIRNINVTHDKELNYDNIWEFSYGHNFWLDHITFNGHDKINGASLGSPDFDKFINFKGNTDFITISDCKIGLGEYGVLLGYPTDTEEIYQQYNGVPCVTLCDNFYKDTLTRAPGLMRYGYFHSMNNYVLNFDMGYTIHTAAKLYAESCYYEAGTGKGAVVNDDYMSNGQQIAAEHAKCYYTDSGSKAVNCYNKNNLKNIKSSPCSWRPSSNYSYKAKTADEAKNYCTKYAGAQTSKEAMTYASFDKAGMPSAGYTVAPDVAPEPEKGAVIDADKTFMLKNLNSGLYMEVTGGKAADGTNVQQWGANGSASHNTWKAMPAQDGYYYIYSQVGNKTYLLDLDCGKTDNGTNIGIFSNTNSDAQLFKFIKNSDGSYVITTKVTDDKSCVEIKDALKDSGANVQQWERNGHGCQSWALEYVDIKDNTPVKGDLNADGKCTAEDIKLLQKWLAKAGTLPGDAKCDINVDGKVNVFDLVALKRMLIKNTNNPAVTTVTTIPVITTTTTTTTAKAPSFEPDNFKFSGKVFLVGDSTVCEYDKNTAESLNRYGWGMKLPKHFNNVTVNNLALSGRSSRSFLTEKNYQTLCNSIGKGDYLFIQFGHNDEKTDEATYPGLGTYAGLDINSLDSSGKNSSGQYSYEWMIYNKYIKIAQDKGAVPVLVTPITRRAADGTANYKSHEKYQKGLIELGKMCNVAVIDMTELTRQLYTNLYNAGGASETAKMHCYIDAARKEIDNTHLSSAGADKIAQMIAEQTKALGLAIGNNLK